MTPFPHVVEVDDSLLHAESSCDPLDHVLEHMAAKHIGSTLVTKHGHLVGIFTATDACRVFCRHLRSIFPQSPADNVA